MILAGEAVKAADRAQELLTHAASVVLEGLGERDETVAEEILLNALAERAGIDPGVVDDVMWGCVGQAGEQAYGEGGDAGQGTVHAGLFDESVFGWRHEMMFL